MHENLFDSIEKNVNLEFKDESSIPKSKNLTNNQEKILCNHCKRTNSN
tara:strand:+ start:3458 stop:3601 length:144 start_codon:yes stop_codon:yes gene_type:complete